MDGSCSLSNCSFSDYRADAQRTCCQFPVGVANGTVDYGHINYFHIDILHIMLGLISFVCCLLVFLSYWRIPRIKSSSQRPILAR